MPNHTYHPGDLVERISTGEIALFASTKTQSVISVEITDITGDNGRAWWPADDCRPAVDHAEELATKDARISDLEAQVAKLEARNERMTQYVDDACECCRCCECQGWNPECSILATKRRKGIDIVTGEQLRAAAEGGE